MVRTVSAARLDDSFSLGCAAISAIVFVCALAFIAWRVM
jgi:hypothetical protein